MSKEKNQITVNQHAVPQAHLKRFKIPTHHQQKLECFNVDSLRIEKPQSTKSICSNDFHYAEIAGSYDEYSQIVERVFGSIEDWYSKNFDRIEQELLNKQFLSKNDRCGISLIISNFYFRGFKFRNETQKGIAEMLDWLRPDFCKVAEKSISSSAQNLSEPEREKVITNAVNSIFESYIQNTSYSTNQSFNDKTVNILTNKKWNVLINNSDRYSFITGDEAVIEINDLSYSQSLIFSNSFSLRLQIFHLSPKIAIITSFPKNEKEWGQTEFDDVTNNKAKIFKNNLFYVNHTYKYCYGPEKTFFEEVIAFEKNGAIPELL
jgi:hypothetical protein